METPVLSIGDFARATQMSVKMLRHYHHIGLLEPADVDPRSGYRRYTPEQIPQAQVIRRFRDLDMPLERIAKVLAAPDLDTRNKLIARHLDELQGDLARTQLAVASLRDLLKHPTNTDERSIGRRRVEAMDAAAIHEVIDMTDASSWYQGALGELYATLAAQDVVATGSAGGMFADDLFAHERGEATIFIPLQGLLRPTGRVSMTTIPAVELATTIHHGNHRGIDRAYGDLGAYVARHALAVDGPIREHYMVSRNDTTDESQWRTEIGWPIFHTGPLD